MSGTQAVEQAKARFLAHKKLYPEPVAHEDLTPLQKRMQSGFGPTIKREARSSK